MIWLEKYIDYASAKGASQKFLFTKWPRIPWIGFVSWPDDNSRYKQTFNGVAILEINFTQIDESVMLFAFYYFNIIISWKRYVFYWNRSVHVILFK